MDALPRLEACSDPATVAGIVEAAHRTVGHLLSDLEDVAILVDALCLDGPIVGASRGFRELTGYALEEVLGANCRMLLSGVPEVAISRSARKNIRDYCSMCQLEGLKDIAETTSVQPNSRRDGSIFMNLFMLGVCVIGRHPYILSVQIPLSEGLSVRLRQAEAAEATEAARIRFRRIREHLRANIAREDVDASGRGLPEEASAAQPEFAFFADRLQDHCLLINGGFTAIRREPEELASNCLVFGDRPVRPTKEGLAFSVRVDEVTKSFTGLPVLGFTRRRPADEPGLYPCVSRCLGASVLIGACGEAFARDQLEHFKMGFKPPPQNEVQTWTSQPAVSPPKRAPPRAVKSGDVLRCVYTHCGHIQLFLNDELVLTFDAGRPLDAGAEHYAVADVCFSVYSLTLMPSERSEPAEAAQAQEALARQASAGSRCLPATPLAGLPLSAGGFKSDPGTIDLLVKEVLLKQGIKAAVATSCNFCVTIADPREKDCPLIAVSQEFERMTGFASSEAVGVNCRFLSQGCDMDPLDLLNLRLSSKTGAPFTAVLPNRKKSGELFLNLLDLRGLTLAKHPGTGEDLWFLVGIQADVTNLAEHEVPSDHLAEMQRVADSIRAAVARELSEFAFAGATCLSKLPRLVSGGEEEPPSADAYQLLPKPAWRAGAPLGQRKPGDSPARSTVPEMLEDPWQAGPALAAAEAGRRRPPPPQQQASSEPLKWEERNREEAPGATVAGALSAFALGGLVCLAGALWLAATARRCARR